MTEYDRWFKSLQNGDEVRVRKPWDDKGRPGGRVVKGKVHINPNGVCIVHYRNRLGRRLYDVMSRPCDAYTVLMPADGREVVYDPKRGHVLPRKKKEQQSA